MSKPWNPASEVMRARLSAARADWPEGATVGLLMLATACAALMMLLYRIAAPAEIFLT